MYFKIKLLSKKNLNFLYKLRNHPISKKYSISKVRNLFLKKVSHNSEFSQIPSLYGTNNIIPYNLRGSKNAGAGPL